MANKLLEEIKELGLSHDEVLEILKKSQEEPPKDENPTDKEIKEEIKEIEEENDEEETNEDEPEKLPKKIPKGGLDAKELQSEISKTVKAEMKELFKMLRQPPPDGEEGDKRIGNTPTVSKNLYERIV